jgi:hypothetical protein
MYYPVVGAIKVSLSTGRFRDWRRKAYDYVRSDAQIKAAAKLFPSGAM